MKYRWAVFDVDGTLYPPSSMEKMFILYMLGKGILPAFNILIYFLTAGMKTLLYGHEEGFKNNKYYLKGLPEKATKRAARQFVRNTILPDISPTGVNRIQHFRKRGYKILVMSGSPDFLTLPLCERLYPDYTVTADTEISHNRFTGLLSGPHPYGERKKELLLNLEKKIGINFLQSVVFANHHADVAHMKLFGKVVAVNPTTDLKKTAFEQGWEMEIWTAPEKKKD
ncbi:MAG: hypothetical protein EH225_05100 [Calditrichaeota bacterium]|nr:MAG: hypothetical protein EH225_05100 [Calditrichota bacterium]